MQYPVNIDLYAYLSIFLGCFLFLCLFLEKKLSYFESIIVLSVYIFDGLISLFLPRHPTITLHLQLPLLYLCVLSTYNSKQKFYIEKCLLLFLRIFNGSHNVYWLFQPVHQKIIYTESLRFEVYELVENMIMYIIILIITIRLVNHLKVYDRNPIQFPAWIYTFTTTYLIFCLIQFIRQVLTIFFIPCNYIILIPSSFYTLIFTSWVGWCFFRKSDFFQKNKISLKQENPQFFLNNCQQEIHQQLNELLHIDKDYLKDNITLRYLSNKLGVRSQTLSQVIQAATGMKYYDFINHLRIEEFKKMLESNIDQKLSIEGIIMQLGFKSKSTFYKHFKKTEGCTPKEYQRKLMASRNK